MIAFKRLIPTLATAALLFGGSTVQAGPVNFSISAASITPGTGYGTDVGSNAENGGTLLDVQFANGFSTQTFSLNSVGDSFSFVLGTVRFNEPESGSGANLGIRGQETDNLGVVSSFTFSDPVGTIASMTATVTVTTGSIADAANDYVLAWSPVVINFGVGGKFELSLDTLSFSNTGSKTAHATVELLAAPDARIAAVPEPASMALVCLALAGAGIARRRRSA